MVDALLVGELLLKMGGFGWRHALRANKLNSALLLVSITTRALVAANVTVPALVCAVPSLRLLNLATRSSAKVLSTLGHHNSST